VAKIVGAVLIASYAMLTSTGCSNLFEPKKSTVVPVEPSPEQPVVWQGG